MSNVIVQGLMLSVIGMGLTFLALGILILVMMLLDRLFSDNKEVDTEEAKPAEKTAANSQAPDAVDEEIVAAIAVALAQVRSLELCEVELGSTLETPPTRWWQIGRVRQSPADARLSQW